MNVRVSTNKLVSGIKLKARDPKTTPRNVVLLTEGKELTGILAHMCQIKQDHQTVFQLGFEPGR
jgi:hypothetical protein